MQIFYAWKIKALIENRWIAAVILVTAAILRVFISAVILVVGTIVAKLFHEKSLAALLHRSNISDTP